MLGLIYLGIWWTLIFEQVSTLDITVVAQLAFAAVCSSTMLNHKNTDC